MKKQTVALLASIGALLISFGYNNCSRVSFAPDAEVLTAKISSGSMVFINGDAPFTNSKDVQLTISNNSAEEMYITNVPNCSSGGVWEKYQAQRPWVLSQTNDVAVVYVKFRENASSSYESDCVRDSIVHDNVPPVVQVTQPVAAYIGTPTATIQFVASDTLSGIQSVLCQSDSGALKSCDSSYLAQGLTEGSHSVRIVARDKAGNDSLPQLVSFAVDRTPPVVQLNSVPSVITSDNQAAFTFSAVDNISGVDRFECQLNAGGFKACVSPFSQVVNEGLQTFSVRAIDRVGNVSSPLNYQWTVDKTVPSVQITGHPAPYSNQAQAQFVFVGTDGSGPASRYDCAVDGTSFVSCSSPFATAALAQASHVFSVRAYDDAGNVSAPATYQWNVDLQAPVVTMTSAPAAVVNQSVANFAFAAVDLGSGVELVECAVDGGGYQACTLSRALSGVAEGSHQFQVRATDRAGNISQPAVATWRVDLTPPTLVITSGPDPLTKQTVASLMFVANDPNGGKVSHTECRLDQAPDFSTCASPVNYSQVGDGTHTFSARAVDEAGNVSDVKSYVWTVDTVGPAINFSQIPAATLSAGSTAIVQFAVTDSGGVASVQCGVNNSLQTCSENDIRTYAQIAVGDYIFSVVAVDALGNSSRKDINWHASQAYAPQSQTIQVSQNSSLDVLVVIDNSGSMATEQKNMAARFGTFIDQLAQTDWQVGIVTTDVTQDTVKRDGRLLEYTGMSNTFVLNAKMDLTAAKTAFAATIQRPANEGSGNETGLAASYRAIQRSQDLTRPENAANATLFRAAAALSILVVTDADETSANGTTVRNTPEGVLNLVKTTWPNKPFRFNSIIVKPNDSACLKVNGNEAYGLSYFNLSNLTGGIVGSVCADDYSSQLTDIGRGTADLVRSATLNCLPQDLNGDGKPDIQLDMADGSTPPSYTLNGLSITFERQLPVGANRIQYACLK